MARDPIPVAVRQLVIARAQGCCERCGLWTDGQIHHRTPKGSGGSSRPDRHDVPNLVYLCIRDHMWAHGNPIAAEAEGFLVPRRNGTNPINAPVNLPGRRRVFLSSAGTYEEAA